MAEGEALGGLAVQPKLRKWDASALVQVFEGLFNAVVMPLAARLPHRRFPELVGIAMVRINVVHDRCGLDPADSFATDADRRAAKVGGSRLVPAVTVTSIRGTPSPPVGLLLLRFAGRCAGGSELLCALHIL